MTALQRALESLEGLSVGDAFGQCFFQERDSDALIAHRELPAMPWYYTDDTEMSLSIVSVLRRFERIDQDALAQGLAHNYHYDRAYGPSMHRVLARIREGEAWRAVVSGSFGGQGSYGNGAAMRAAPIGAYFADDMTRVVEQAALSAEVTHTHPEGVAGVIAVAVAAAVAWQSRGRALVFTEFLDAVAKHTPDSEVRSKLLRARAITQASSQWFAANTLGNGTEMAAQDTVPYALWCCAQSSDDYAEAMWLTIAAGGDRDTLCAIVGGVIAARLGAHAIPQEWVTRRETLPQWHLS
jgi:ADP-ribosylglycohydrolase